MDKQDMKYTCNAILFSLKKEGILTNVMAWMILEAITLTEIRQS